VTHVPIVVVLDCLENGIIRDRAGPIPRRFWRTPIGLIQPLLFGLKWLAQITLISSRTGSTGVPALHRPKSRRRAAATR